MSLFHRALGVTAAAAVLGLGGVTGVPSAQAAPAPAVSSAAVTTPAAAALARMTLAQRVGQLFMVGTAATEASAGTLSAISNRHVGSVMLTGRSSAGTAATARVVKTLNARATGTATAGVPLLVATDQEGGKVQVLSGTGFSRIPSALTQGRSSTTALRASAKTWGRQLRAAGVDVDLAPVLDTVPSATAAAKNPPIGAFAREYGYTTARVASRGTAFAQGMADAGVSATVKHFPGLGRVTANPDTTAGVTDRTTIRKDPYLTPFATAVRAGAPLLMMSTAYYSRIDPAHPAAFSPTVVTGMVRGDLGFRGVVVSDDLGSAQQVQAWTPGLRAVSFLSAGGDLVLTVTPRVLPKMYDRVLAKAEASRSFRAKVDASALRVLTAKQARGLLPAATTPAGYDGQSPSGACATSARTVERADIAGLGHVELRYSTTCRTAWARVVSTRAYRDGDAVRPGATVRRTRDGRSYSCAFSTAGQTSCFTPMVDDAGTTSTAKGTLADGSVARSATTAAY